MVELDWLAALFVLTGSLVTYQWRHYVGPLLAAAGNILWIAYWLARGGGERAAILISALALLQHLWGFWKWRREGIR